MAGDFETDLRLSLREALACTSGEDERSGEKRVLSTMITHWELCYRHASRFAFARRTSVLQVERWRSALWSLLQVA